MKKNLCVFLLSMLIVIPGIASQRKTNLTPTKEQQAMIDRKYGLFLHYGINTYLDVEWSDGTDAASIYSPPADIGFKASEWVRTAKEAGMRSIVLITKHHDGFCLWDSKYTDRDIANTSITHKVDVVKAVSDACKQYGIAFSIYYSLWDRAEPCYKEEDKYRYITFMKNQLEELMTHYGEVHELWFDGAWDRKIEDWHLSEVYDHVKKMQPGCQISTNWTLGKRPVDMKEGDTIVYFPSDFRLWDPYLPVVDDPKIYNYGDEKYYLPYESTQTISVLGNWFNHPSDKTVRDLDDLEEIFYVSTTNDNCLLLNIPPDTNGDLNPLAVERINQLAKRLNIDNGKPFPKKLNKPRSITSFSVANASSVHESDTLHHGAAYAVDSDVSTSWKCAETTGWITINLERESTFKQIDIIEGQNNIKQYSIDIKINGKWENIYKGEALSDASVQSFMGYGFGEIRLPKSVTTQSLRLNIEKSNDLPSVYSVRLK